MDSLSANQSIAERMNNKKHSYLVYEITRISLQTRRYIDENRIGQAYYCVVKDFSWRHDRNIAGMFL